MDEIIVDERMRKVEQILRAAFEKHDILNTDIDYGPTYHAVVLDVLLKDGC